MKGKYLLLSILIVAIGGAIAEEDLPDIPDDFNLDDFDLDADEELLRELEQKQLNADLARENSLAAKIAADIASVYGERKGAVEIDPCSTIHCGAGRVCEAKGQTASCVCITDCPNNPDPRRLVCTSLNETWNSDCQVHRHRCLCDTNHPDCQSTAHHHIHIDYYGQCREMPECTEEEMIDFPRRMRDWLYNVMRDMAERNELNEHYMSMEMEAESNLTRRWSNAAVWKWCDLDGHPHDRSVSRHELFPIRAPLVSLEHCISPFLETCDPNGDHRITLKEWGQCLQLDEADMLDRCEEISNKDSHISQANEV